MNIIIDDISPLCYSVGNKTFNKSTIADTELIDVTSRQENKIKSINCESLAKTHKSRDELHLRMLLKAIVF